MVRIRMFEESAGKLVESGDMPGFLHLYVGQEAVAAGVMSVLDDVDQITSTHRGHGHAIAKGAEFRPMFAELYGKTTGYCKGRGGSMHIVDTNRGMLGANAIVGGGIPIAIGAAFAAQYRG
ncbi:MAG: pyruvate dehydrogenase (acetyl-transferring) E1 component subunit alpha, partial [Actinobacteria bacterium]|nr:pyruvate dehydrogenase (acetyl-transferring) E1 component subunit alpha [Actinomycetota bacterium]